MYKLRLEEKSNGLGVRREPRKQITYLKADDGLRSPGIQKYFNPRGAISVVARVVPSHRNTPVI